MLKLKKIITCVLITACLVCSVGVASACNEGKDYSEDITKLQQQLETLLNQNGNYSIEIEKLQQKIDDLKNQNGNYSSEINDLQEQLDNLKNENNNLKNEIDDLKQNQPTVEAKVYKIGETFTYSYQGMDFFSITVLNRSQIKIKNINMTSQATARGFLRILSYDYYGEITTVTNFSSTFIEKNEEYIERVSFSENYTTLDLGFPSGERDIIPYAIFDLTA